MKKFALIGAAGFVAPRHLQAIHDVGGDLLAATDPSDSVGILDRFFPNARFFSEIERFDRFVEKCRRQGPAVDFVSICSPNYLHDAHVRLALRTHAHAICEKPLVLSPWNLDALESLESEYERRIFTVLQLRLIPNVVQLANKYRNYEGPKVSVDLKYITRRGRWYHTSWKGDEQRSGGLAMNIGVHFFDMLLYVFGRAQGFEVFERTSQTMTGTLELEKANVTWQLSVDEGNLPDEVRAAGGHAYRSLMVDEEQLDLSAGLVDLHTQVYREVLCGKGFGVGDARPAIELVHKIRTSALCR